MSSNNCIYEVFEWMLVMYKYIGSIPLPGLYEWKGDSKVRRLLLSILLPLLFCISAFFGAYQELIRGFDQYLENNLINILVGLLAITSIVYCFSVPLLFHFRLSKVLVIYLRKHRTIDHLIKPHKNRLKLIVNCVLIVTFTYNLIIGVGINYDGDNIKMSVAAMNTLYLSLCSGCQPLILYILFQYVLRCAFTQLLRQIEDEKEDMNEMKLREYGTLYCHLCGMGKQLDHMTSPLMALKFLYCYLNVVFCSVFITDYQSLTYVVYLIVVAVNAVVLSLVPSSAQDTKNLAMKIGPKVFSHFDSNDKNLRKEMEIFAIQTFLIQTKFSASGLFNLDRNLILNMFQSILSQWIVFYKIKHDLA